MSLQPYEAFERLRFERPEPGVLKVLVSSPLKLNVMDAQLHTELAGVWRIIDRDDETACVIVTGAGAAFSAGGDLKHQEQVTASHELQARLFNETRDLVYGMLDCRKPIVSAVRGWAVGAGLACALLADISIVAKTAKLSDGHAKIGLPAGDHAAILWPLLCGLAKAKYYLLLGDPIAGDEAERIGLVSLAVDEAELDARALDVAVRLAQGPRRATAWTKQMLNHWPRQAGPAFEASLALELFAMNGAEAREGLAAFLEKRSARFNDL